MSSSGALHSDNASILSLAEHISSLCSRIVLHLKSTGHPEPRFAPDAVPVPDSPEYEALRAPLNDAALDLLRLVNGPRSSLREFFFSHYDLAALQVALDRGFFNHVPLAIPSGPNKASIAEIAEKAGMDEDRAGRILRLLATHRIFEEVEGETGIFRHTASSAEFARDGDFQAVADMQMDDMFKAASETSAVISRSPLAPDHANSSAFHLHYGVPMYQYYAQHPAKGTRFSRAMSSWSQVDRQLAELRDSFPWASLGGGKVVDVGGGSGHISIALARQFPSLRFVVQDISPHQLSQAQEELGGRVTFQQHDFFSPQPIQDASAFLLRQCLHNYNDQDSVKILRALVPALEACSPETPLLINDVVLPDSHTVTKYEEHHLRQIDFCMLVTLGAKQRSETEFEQLLKRADARFEIVKVDRNPLGVGLLQVHLNTA